MVTFSFYIQIKLLSPYSLYGEKIFPSPLEVLCLIITRISGFYSIQRFTSRKKARNLFSPLKRPGLLSLPLGVTVET